VAVAFYPPSSSRAGAGGVLPSQSSAQVLVALPCVHVDLMGVLLRPLSHPPPGTFYLRADAAADDT